MHIIALQKKVKYPTVKKSAISIPEGARISWNIFEKPRISGITVCVMLQRRSYICRIIRFWKPWGIHFITISTQRFPKTTQTKKSIHDMVFYLTWQLCCFNFKGCNSHFCIKTKHFPILTLDKPISARFYEWQGFVNRDSSMI